LVTARLVDVADLNPALGGSPEADESVAFLPMSAVNANQVVAINGETRRYSEVNKGYTPFRGDDVLVAKITPCFENGKIALAKPTKRYGFGSTEFHVIRAHSQSLDPRYLVHFLRQDRIRVDGQRRMTGSGGQRRVPEHFLSGLEVPLPPLPEQRRIAAILDKADSLRTKRRAALATLDTLTQSVFLDMFGDPTTNPKAWPLEQLGNIAETTSGGTPSRDVEEYFGGEIPWVKSGELHQGVVTKTEETLTQRGLAESSAKLMPSGTVLVAMYGATVGAVAVLGIQAATNQAVCCISTTDRILADYLVVLLRKLTPALLAKRVGGAQPNLSQDLIRKLVIPVPPRQLQDTFTARLTALGTSKRVESRSLSEMDSLLRSLQHHAFRGGL
jgi:type I restriction enzyme, S subunit